MSNNLNGFLRNTDKQEYLENLLGVDALLDRRKKDRTKKETVNLSKPALFEIYATQTAETSCVTEENKCWTEKVSSYHRHHLNPSFIVP